MTSRVALAPAASVPRFHETVRVGALYAPEGPERQVLQDQPLAAVVTYLSA